MWVWVNSGSWWWTGRPGVLQFMGLQRVGHDWATEPNWTEGMLAIRSLIPLPFPNPAWTSRSSQIMNCWSLPSLENFEHYFASMWEECNCAVVWTFFCIAFLWDWNENWPFPVLWPLLSFQICWHDEWGTFTASSFRIWNSSIGIPSPPLALFVVMLAKAHLTSHFRMSGSRWVTTLFWLTRQWHPTPVLLPGKSHGRRSLVGYSPWGR